MNVCDSFGKKVAGLKRIRGGTTAFPQCIVILSILSRSFMTSALHASSRKGKIKMVVKANPDAMAEVFNGRPLLFVNCLSDEDLTLISLKFSCIQVVCREIQVRFTEELSVRRVASNGKWQTYFRVLQWFAKSIACACGQQL